MNKFIATAAAACFALSGAAHAVPVKISEFTIGAFNSAVGYNDFTVQDFESIATTPGYLPADLPTNVGTFSAITTDADGVEQTGSGSTCNTSGAPSAGTVCNTLFLNNTTTNGQGNMVPDTGIWSLNANDTFGIAWDVVKGEGGSLFNRIVFAIMDASDQNATTTISGQADEPSVSILVDGVLKNLSNATQKLIVIDFADLKSSASIEIRSSKLNDSFSIDGASVGVVPLPAGGLLLLTGFGALALRRRRKAA